MGKVKRFAAARGERQAARALSPKMKMPAATNSDVARHGSAVTQTPHASSVGRSTKKCLSPMLAVSTDLPTTESHVRIDTQDGGALGSARDQIITDTHGGVVASPSSARKRGRPAKLPLSPSNAVSGASSSGEGPTLEARSTVLPPVTLSPRTSSTVGQSRSDTPFSSADDSERHCAFDTQSSRALGPIIDELREHWRRRQAWHRAEKSLTLQAKALCRRLAATEVAPDATREQAKKAIITGGAALYEASMKSSAVGNELAALALAAIYPLVEARKTVEASRKTVEKRLVALASELPIAAWVESQRGIGLLGAAGIIGEAGDLGGYANPAKLWKRMGLAVINGERQRRVQGVAAFDHGYNAARRSVVWTIGESLIKGGGELRGVYDARKAYLVERARTRGQDVIPSAKSKGREAGTFVTEGHVHADAKRYMEKRMLREIWRAWRDRSPTDTHVCVVAPAPSGSM